MHSFLSAHVNHVLCSITVLAKEGIPGYQNANRPPIKRRYDM